MQYEWEKNPYVNTAPNFFRGDNRRRGNFNFWKRFRFRDTSNFFIVNTVCKWFKLYILVRSYEIIYYANINIISSLYLIVLKCKYDVCVQILMERTRLSHIISSLSTFFDILKSFYIVLYIYKYVTVYVDILMTFT